MSISAITALAATQSDMTRSAAIILVAAAFLASAVEMVEALTIVLAVGVTRGWRSTLFGVGTAVVALAAVIAVLGPALSRIGESALPWLRLFVGALLLIFGLQWLRKAILRSSGYKALHNEDATFREEVEAARHAGTVTRAGMDWYSYTISFKGVFLEGLEVVFIVLTFGSTNGKGGIALAALGAAVAVVLVGIVGVAVHAPLSRVPENTMKFAVGIMLTTFGIFWGAEGARVSWPGGDVAILYVLAFVLVMSLGYVALLKQHHERSVAGSAAVRGAGD
jgi:uncharacterized membrane protein